MCIYYSFLSLNIFRGGKRYDRINPEELISECDKREVMFWAGIKYTLIPDETKY